MPKTQFAVVVIAADGTVNVYGPTTSERKAIDATTSAQAMADGAEVTSYRMIPLAELSADTTDPAAPWRDTPELETSANRPAWIDAPQRPLAADTAPHCRNHLQFRSDCAACVAERDASNYA